MQVYGRMINLQNSLRRYWESVAVGDYKKKPRYYDHLCKVFGTDINGATNLDTEFYDTNVSNLYILFLGELFRSLWLN